MHTSSPMLRQERLSELVSHLSGAPLEQSRRVVDDSARRSGTVGDSLFNVAEALVSLRGVAV